MKWVTKAALDEYPRRLNPRTDVYTCVYCGTRRTSCAGWWAHAEARARHVRLFWYQRLGVLAVGGVLVWLTSWLG